MVNIFERYVEDGEDGEGENGEGEGENVYAEPVLEANHNLANDGDNRDGLYQEVDYDLATGDGRWR